MRYLPTNLEEDDYGIKGEKQSKFIKKLLFLENNGKVVASSIQLTKTVYDGAGLVFVRRYLKIAKTVFGNCPLGTQV